MQVFTITVSAKPAELHAADELVRTMSPSARQTYALGGTQKYELPTSEVSLSTVRLLASGTVHGWRSTCVRHALAADGDELTAIS